MKTDEKEKNSHSGEEQNISPKKMETDGKEKISHSIEEGNINILLNNERCDQCGMLFTSSDSLRIHKEKFCIGVFDSGFNQTNSPLNSYYTQSNHEDLDNIKNDVKIMKKKLQNESVSNISKEFDDFLEINSLNTKNNNHTNNDQDILTTNRTRTPRNDDERITSEKKIQDELISSNLANNELNRRNNNVNNENQIMLSSKNISNSSNKIEELLNITENMNLMTQRSDQMSINSHSRYGGTPNDKMTISYPIGMQTKDKNRSISKIESDDTHNVIEEVNKYKSKKSMEQSLRDLEDHLISDTNQGKKFIDDIGEKSNSTDIKAKKNYFDVNKNDPYKKLLNDYDDLKMKEGEIFKEVNEHNPDFKSYNALHFDKESNDTKHDFLSLFDNLDDIDLELFGTFAFTSVGNKSKMNDETFFKMRQIQEKTDQLDRERRAIQYKFESLKNNASFAAPLHNNPSLSRLLSELKDQQTLNEASLNLLREKFTQKSQLQPGIAAKIFYPSLYSSSNTSSNPFILKNLNNNDLNEEDIRAMRLNYLKNGGHDQNFLNKFTEMEYNLRYSNRITSKPKNFQLNHSYASDLEERIKNIDAENKRIESELEKLQKGLIYGSVSNTDKNRIYENINLPSIQQIPVSQNYQYKYSSPRYIDQMNHQFSQSKRNQLPNKQISSYISDQLNENHNLIRLRNLPPAPYDPNGGFVLFIDFVTNIDPSYASARVITCLHHPKSGLGEPSVLPIVNTETFSERNNLSTVALISTKQPVPRCPPQQALNILIELQMGQKNANQTRLKSCAWVKIPLFDSNNRLLSGRWRCQFKILPIKSESTINNLNNIPDYGNTELFYRLVNLRDSDEQTNAAISPILANQYQLTAQEQEPDKDLKDNFDESTTYDNKIGNDKINNQLSESQIKKVKMKKDKKNENSNFNSIELKNRENNITTRTVEPISTRNRKEPKFLKGEMEQRIKNLEDLCELITKEVVDQNKNMIDMNKNLISEIRALREAYVKQDEDFEELKNLLKKIYDLNRQNFAPHILPSNMPPLIQSSHMPHNLPGPINNSILDQFNQSMLNNLSFQSVQTPLNLNQVHNFQNLNQTIPSSASVMTKQIPHDINQIHSQQKSASLPQYQSVSECSNQSQLKSIQSQIAKQQAQPTQLSTNSVPFKINPTITSTSTPQANQFVFKPAQQSTIQAQIVKPNVPSYEFSPTKSSELSKQIFKSTSFASSSSQFTSNIFSGTNLFKPSEDNMPRPFSNLPSSENIFKSAPTNISNIESSNITKPNVESEEGEATANPEEYEPQVEFKPIVKLSEVEVKTGEEEEDVLFKQRCKLFRFDKLTNEWKEKGIGDLKLLKHKETNAIRVLMRRDQVLKMCANHRINREMKLNEISAKQISWFAIDFSDNEAKNELLLAKFRTPEEASQFKTEFEKALKEIKNLDVSKSPFKTFDKKNLVPEKLSLAEAFKTDNWKCNSCYAPNKKEDLKCACCSARRIHSEADRDAKENKPTTQPIGKQLSSSLQANQQADNNPIKCDSSVFKTTLFEKQSLPSFGSVAGNALIFPKNDMDLSQKCNFKPLGFTGGFGTQQNQNSVLFGTKPTPLFGTQSSKAEEGQEEEGESQNPEEYEPQIDFKPLVKLNEVEVKTGEEDEEILFKQRCKLFRFDCNAKEWKEKGTGEIKILKHKTNKNMFRILMRRDQVLKLCANHRITSDLKWEIFNEKQVRWYALDYSEGEGKNELLAVRFKNEEDSKKFKLICEEAQRTDELDGSNLKADLNGDKTKIKSEELKPSLSSLFKKTGWTCQTCYVVNEKDLDKCVACQKEKDNIKKSEEIINVNKDSKSKFLFGHTEKDIKSTISFSKSFGQISSTEKKENLPNIFENKSGTSFSDLAKTGNLLNRGFTGGFGTQQNQNSVLFGTKPTPLFGTQSSKAEEGQEEEGESQNPEEYEPQIDFKPLVKLNEVEVKTGEEDEEILFKQRCKLFRFDCNAKEWKEKGVGEIKILKHKTKENYFRILMRRDQVLKLCANHRITPEIKLEIINEKQVRWLATDCSESIPQTEFLAAKFRSMEDAKKFAEEFEKLQKLSKNIEIFDNNVNKQMNEKYANCSINFQKTINDNIDDIKIVYEEKATTEQVEKARSFRLPDTFYLYEKKKGCSGCVGCENEQ